jgi:xylan 1,4-beta-xylosidase
MRGMLLAALAAALLGHRAQAQDTVSYDWFEYSGRDAVFSAPLPKGSYRNPILAGYYPDPSVTRAGDRFYLVNSSFAHWPGIPIHESADLVHWKLIGHALTDPTKVNFDGRGISRGVFAPAIEFHDGRFYIVNTLVDAGGNFVVTATDPSGPWSDPVFLPKVDGIDPSLFFDDDGKAYLVHNGPPEGKPLYDGHRAIWIHEFDAATLTTGAKRLLIDGGVDLAKKPIWIEGPHLYRVNGWYYLLCAEGGTERNHSAVIFRSKSPLGPFEPGPENPILTQLDLPPDRADPVTNAGHADLVQMRDGSWWAVFLASRPYEGFRFNTGRETFLLPVTWKDGWPRILPAGQAVPGIVKAPNNARPSSVRDDLTGNIRSSEEFFGNHGPEWIQVHVPRERWLDFEARRGALTIHPLAVNLDEKRNPSFLARRQQHQNFDASTQLIPPAAPGIAAGIAVFQSEDNWYFLAARRTPDGLQLFLERRAGARFTVTGGAAIPPVAALKLRVSATGAKYSFYYDAGQGWHALRENDDGTFLSSEVAGGFVGTVLGPYARQEKT